jgi:hypothetical protein
MQWKRKKLQQYKIIVINKITKRILRIIRIIRISGLYGNHMRTKDMRCEHSIGYLDQMLYYPPDKVIEYLLKRKEIMLLCILGNL